MTTPLHVLLIADEHHNHVAEILDALRAGGFDPHYEAVDRPPLVRKALRATNWQIVIAEYPLAFFPEVTTLPMLVATYALPMLVVPRLTQEDLLVRLIKAGVQDVISLPQLKRLGSVVTREINLAVHRRERRQEEDARERSLQNLLHSLEEMILSLSAQAEAPLDPDTPEAHRRVAQLACATALLAMRIGSRDVEITTHDLAQLLPTLGTPASEAPAVPAETPEPAAPALMPFSFEPAQSTQEEIVNALAATVEKRDPFTAGHQRRVALLATAMAMEMNLSEDQVEGIRVAGILHDIGKICIPAEILCKPGVLTEMEVALIKTHPQAGYDILKSIPFTWPVAQIVLQHQERSDGSGYPYGLMEEDLLRESRVIAVADVVEAISNRRSYRPAYGLEKALEEIGQQAGIQYDSEAVQACLRLFQRGFTFE